MERKRLLPNEFYKYITEPISMEEMRLWVKVNNINTEKCELFFDFINSLHHLINTTYLGDEVIKNDKEKEGHFKWCWNKTLNNFKEERINFNTLGDHYTYLWNFFYEGFYDNYNEERVDKLIGLLDGLFRLYIPKTKSELDMLSEIYLRLENNLTVNK
tara:strand:- start:3246 stop:3719 length:474 start_codon:yes stop_codon:yes gene_type:complete